MGSKCHIIDCASCIHADVGYQCGLSNYKYDSEHYEWLDTVEWKDETYINGYSFGYAEQPCIHHFSYDPWSVRSIRGSKDKLVSICGSDPILLSEREIEQLISDLTK